MIDVFELYRVGYQMRANNILCLKVKLIKLKLKLPDIFLETGLLLDVCNCPAAANFNVVVMSSP